MLALVAMFVVIIAILFGNRSQFDFSCHRDIITYFAFLWYNWRWKGGRVVEGTGLENQRWKHPQVRILSFPPFYRLSRRFLVDVDFGAGGGVDTEIGEDD